MTADSLIDPESAAKVGTVVAIATGEVNRRDWQRWAAAVGDHNPLWFDPDYARPHGYRDIICPPLYLQYAILGVAALGDLRPDGSSGAVTGSLAFPRAPRRMAGGESTTFHLPAYHRDEIEMVRTVESIVEKEGRSGRFVLVTWRTEYRNQHRELVAEATTSMIARPHDRAGVLRGRRHRRRDPGADGHRRRDADVLLQRRHLQRSPHPLRQGVGPRPSRATTTCSSRARCRRRCCRARSPTGSAATGGWWRSRCRTARSRIPGQELTFGGVVTGKRDGRPAWSTSTSSAGAATTC